MATSWKDQNIRCPFYRGEDARKHKIICEGLGDARSMAWNFRSERQRIRQLEIFCQDCYANCEMYRMIRESKYN